MDIKTFNENMLVDMMFKGSGIDSFKYLWDKDKDAKKWGTLLRMCYWELSYERVGGDEGYLENPPINTERIAYLEELITFLENAGVKAPNDAPKV